MQQQQPQEEPTKKVSHIRSVSSTARRYRHFGALLAEWRKNAGVTQPYVVGRFLEYCTRQGLARLQLVQPGSQVEVKPLTIGQYGKLERQERRAPKFDELLPLYVTLTVGCGAEPAEGDRDAYIELARAAIEPKLHHCETITPELWDALADQLARADGLDPANLKKRQWHEVYLPERVKQETPSQEQHLSPEIVRILRKDTSHILERDAWVEQMLDYREEGKRLVTIQAISGAGKTRALYILLKRLATLPDCWPCFYTFRVGEGKMPDDYLDSLLAALRTDLQLPSLEDKQTVSREECIGKLLIEMQHLSSQGKRIALLLDDVQITLDPSTGEFSDAWQYFLDVFVSDEHHSILYLATREWPHWHTRDRTFLVETELEKLSPEAGVTIWQRLGFSDVSKDLLYKASKKCDGIPQFIELGACSLDRPGHIYLWPRSGGARNRQAADNRHSERMRTWLDDDTVFDKTDVAARKELAQVLSQRISHHAYHLLDLLAISPIPLPFALIEQVSEHPEIAFDTLVRCSLISREAAEEGRAALVPLAREARIHELSQQRKDELESLLTTLYERWLYDLQQFVDDTEQAVVISELVVLYIKRECLLKAADLLATFGWLCAQLGHTSRIERYAKTIRLTTDPTPEREAGKALLLYQVISLTGQVVNPKERQAAYQRIYTQVQGREISLQPHSEVMLTHFLAMPLLRTGRFTEAQTLFEATMQHISQQFVPPEVYAAFLHSKTNLFEIWSKDKETKKNTKQVTYLQEQCVTTLTEAAECWRTCLRNALPLSQTYIKFKLARTLNDLALNLRLLGRIAEAEEAINECILMKKESKEGESSQSYAISLGERAQILAAGGKFGQSHELNREAQAIMDKHVEQGNSRARSNKGMLLFEQASVYVQQARLSEAKLCLKEALELLEGTTSREEYKQQAIDLLNQIEPLLSPPLRYQLDQHWFERYHHLAGYNDLEALAQAGPFTLEEQYEWESLFPHRSEPRSKARLKELAANSQERELIKSLREEPCIPQLTYPFIDIDDIASRIAGFRALQTEIHDQERHPMVRRLYLERIEEHLHGLHLLEAVHSQKIERVREHNEWLYGKPSLDEMTIALSEFVKMLQRARNHPEASHIREQIIAQLKHWHISPEDFAKEERTSIEGKKPSAQKRELMRKGISASALQHLLKEVLDEYHFTDWQLIPSPERGNFAIDPDCGTVEIPTRKRYSPLQGLELVAEELEIHVFRPEAGKRSPLALLGSGTRGYLVLDEGLAVHYVQQARTAQGLERKTHSHVATLALGMVTGIIFPPLSFTEVFTFLKQAFSISHLLKHASAGRYTTSTEVEKEAEHDALKQIIRTYRGVPDWTHAMTTCNLKDRMYLQGETEVAKKLKTMPLEQMLIGAVGVEQLEDTAELNLLKPSIRHLQLACKPELLTQLIKLNQEKEN